jgi:hypothetical protein
VIADGTTSLAAALSIGFLVCSLTGCPDPGESWDGQTTLTCTNGQKITVRGKHIDMPKGAGPGKYQPHSNCEQSPDGCPLIFAFNGCDLDIVDSTLSAPMVAWITAPARVTFTNTTVHGEIVRRGNPQVSGLASLDEEDREAEAAKRLDAQAQTACDGVVECYRTNSAWGNVSGRLAVPVGANGAAMDARYENGSAPDVVRECLVAVGKKKRLTKPDGRAGLMTCDWAGSLLPTAQRMDFSRAFVPGGK